MPEEDVLIHNADIVPDNKSYDNLYDFGISTPESEEDVEKNRQNAVNLVVNLLKDDNQAAFNEAVATFFEGFGIPASQDPQIQKWNDRVLADAYRQRTYFEVGGTIDLMHRGKDGVYSNINLIPVEIDGKEMINIAPGACSSPNPIPPRPENPPLYVRWQDVNFYRVFEEVIGIHPRTRVDDNPRILNNPNEFYLFYVDPNDKSYIRQKVNRNI